MSDTDPTQTITTDPPVDDAQHASDAPQQAQQDDDLAWLDQRYPQHAGNRDAQYRELAKSYQNLEQAYSQRQQPEPEQEYIDPSELLPVDVDPGMYQRFQNGLQRDPHGTIQTVLGNADAFPTQIVNEALLVQFQLDPMSAIRTAVGPMLEERFSAYQQQSGQAYQPWIENAAHALGDASEHIVRQTMPNYDEYRDRVLGWLEQRPHELDNLNRAEDIAQRLLDVAGMFWAADQRQQQQPAGAPAPQPRRPASPRSTTTRPNASEERGKAFLDSMVNGHGL